MPPGHANDFEPSNQTGAVGLIDLRALLHMWRVSRIDFYAAATAFGAVPIVFSLAAIVGLNDNPNAAFRIVFNGATSSTGNNRIDNIVVEGTSTESATIPEPASVLLLLSGLGGIYKIRRKKMAKERAATEGRPYSCT